MPVAELAARLGRHRSTIYRKLARNRFHDLDHAGDRWRDVSGYYPVTAPVPGDGAWRSWRGTRICSSMSWTGCVRAGRRSGSPGGFGWTTQAGRMENTNGRLRRYLPGNVLPERLTAGSLDALAAKLNA